MCICNATQRNATQRNATQQLYLLTNFKFILQKSFLHLVKSFLTSITFDNLSRKIKIPCLVINKIILRRVHYEQHF